MDTIIKESKDKIKADSLEEVFTDNSTTVLWALLNLCGIVIFISAVLIYIKIFM